MSNNIDDLQKRLNKIKSGGNKIPKELSKKADHPRATKVSNFKIEVLKKTIINPEDIYNYDVIPMINFACLIISRKGSGKTNLVYNLIKAKSLPEKTTIIIFCPTFYSDETYKIIFDKLEEAGYNITVYTSFDDPISHTDILQDYLNELIEEDKSKKMGVKEDDIIILPKEEVNEDPNTPPYVSKYLFIFDDNPEEYRHRKSYANFCKTHRHYQASSITATQAFVDIPLNLYPQYDVFIMYKGIPDAKIEYLNNALSSDIPYPQMLQAYKNATEEKFNFWYYNKNTNQMRKNLDELI